MNPKVKQAIGAFLAISLIGILIYYFFFQKRGTSFLPGRNRRKPVSNGGSKPTSGGGTISRPPNGGGNTINYGYKPASKGFPIRPGSQGQEVYWLQEALRDAGYNPGTLDGVWGRKTTAAFEMAFPGTATTVRSDDWEPLMVHLFPEQYEKYI